VFQSSLLAAQRHLRSSARSVRIEELQNAGKPDEKELPVGKDRGYLWRLNLYARYLEKDDGVYVQIEFVALSRSVPQIVVWFVNPYIRSIPREYLTNYLRATQSALSLENRHPANGERKPAIRREDSEDNTHPEGQSPPAPLQTYNISGSPLSVGSASSNW
jgi:hypothetical protein